MAGAEDKKTGTSATAGTLVLDSADALAATQAAEAIASGASSLVGATVAGRYKVLKRLGEGGMGTVYEALHTVLEKHVALKVLHPELARKAHLVERFLQEAKAASRIRHENVIDISDFGAEDGQVFFAMELLQGHDLHEEITQARNAGKLLPWERTKNIFLQVCSALAVAHERGIVHRDLKPENIYLIEFRGDPDFVKLLDFGIAKMTDVSTSDEGRKLTKTGMLFGTPEYMAPEQARGEKADHRVDIYAMGCILFLLVSNRLPFKADSFMGVLSQHLTDDPPEIAPETFDQIGAPREIAEVIDRALEKNRDDRWQTIDEMAAAICEICGDPAPKRARPSRIESVAAPGETTRMRTPTDQPRSRTPSGSGRARTPTGPARSSTGPGRSKPPTAPPRSSTPEVSWVGNAAPEEQSTSVISLGPVPESEDKHHAAAIIAAVVVVVMLAAGAYALGVFGKRGKAVAVEPTGSAAGSQAPAAVTPVTPPPPVVSTPEPAPPNDRPAGDTKAGGPAPASRPDTSPRPTNRPDPSAGAVTKPDSAPVTKPDSSPVTKPDSSPVTKPDTTPAPKPEGAPAETAPEPKPAESAPPATPPPSDPAPATP